MSHKKYILVDRDYDQMEMNGDNEWDTVRECLADIKDDLAENSDNGTDYLPWRIVLFDAKVNREAMQVHTKISRIETEVTLFTAGGMEL